MTTTWAVGRARLLELANFLLGLREEQFDFSEVVNRSKVNESGEACGTVCCAIGWTPAIWPKLVKWHHWTPSDSIVLLNADNCVCPFDVMASELFGISRSDAIELFFGGDLLSSRPIRPWLSKKARENWSTKASIKQVVSAIRAYVRWRDRKITRAKTKKAPSRRKAK